jgi:hypothetical protein
MMNVLGDEMRIAIERTLGLIWYVLLIAGLYHLIIGNTSQAIPEAIFFLAIGDVLNN